MTRLLATSLHTSHVTLCVTRYHMARLCYSRVFFSVHMAANKDFLCAHVFGAPPGRLMSAHFTPSSCSSIVQNTLYHRHPEQHSLVPICNWVCLRQLPWSAAHWMQPCIVRYTCQQSRVPLTGQAVKHHIQKKATKSFTIHARERTRHARKCTRHAHAHAQTTAQLNTTPG